MADTAPLTPAGTYICSRCALPMHLYASFSGEQDWISLDLLGWVQVHGHWICSDCSSRPEEIAKEPGA